MKTKLMWSLAFLSWVAFVAPMGVMPIVNRAQRLEKAPPSLTQSVLKLGLFDGKMKLGSGSCFIVAHKDGYWYAITAKHCVEEVDQWRNTVRDYPRLVVGNVEAELLRKDPDADVALIRFKDTGQDYHVLELATPTIGESCTVVGHAGGTFVQFKGWVAAFDFKLGDEKYTVANSGLFPGCSGGPLLNDNREVIGVTVAVAAYGGIWDTVGCFVPVKFIRSLMETI